MTYLDLIEETLELERVRKVDLNDYTHRCRECYQEYGSHHEKCLELSKNKLENLLVFIHSRDAEWLIHKLETALKDIKGAL